jgi:hypothetical protein
LNVDAADQLTAPPCFPQVGLFAIGAWQAVGMVFYSLLQRCCGPQWRAAHVRLPALGTLPLNGVLATAAAGALCATWAAAYNASWSWPLQVCWLASLLCNRYLICLAAMLGLAVVSALPCIKPPQRANGPPCQLDSLHL